MSHYKCPLCGKEVERDVTLFLDHSNEHVIDAIKKDHPDWVESDGTCQPCADYFEKQLSGEIGDFNLGPKETRKRYVLGFGMLVISVLLIFWFFNSELLRSWRWLLFFPLFGAIFCLLEAKRKTCSVLAELGSINMDTGPGKIENTEAANKLRAIGRAIVFESALASAILTTLLCVMP